MIIVVIIFISAIRLVLTCIKTLMQTVPKTIVLSDLRKDIQNVDGVIAIHDLHVWKLVETKVIGSVHIVCLKKTKFMEIASQIKMIFHSYGIHASTIQPEFIKIKQLKEERKVCVLDCGKKDCEVNSCCPPPLKLEPALNDDQLDEILKKNRNL